MNKRLILYVHGQGGCAEEASVYEPLFPDCAVKGMVYTATSPWEAREEFSYPYYVCAGRHRHGKEHVDCDMKAILIDEVEYQIEQFYDTISLSLEDRTATEQFMVTFIQSEQEKFKSELDGLRREKDKLEHKQEKLLEAHLNDAIPLNLLKKEQKSLSKQLVAIEHEIRLRAATFDDAYTNLTLVLNMLQDCGKMYRSAPDHIKRLLNQAIFNRVWIDEDGRTDPELSSVCGEIVDTSKRIQKSASASADADSEKKLFQPGSKFFEQGWNNDTMVEVRGVEPLSEDLSTRISPSAAAVQVFPFLLPRRRGNRSGSFIDPASRKALAGSFPILNDARICNDRSLQADALRYLSSNGKCVIVVFCI